MGKIELEETNGGKGYIFLLHLVARAAAVRSLGRRFVLTALAYKNVGEGKFLLSVGVGPLRECYARCR